MSRNVNFETVFEKLGRIITRKYNIDVMMRGNTAYTDGEKIVIPMLEDVTSELYADANGFLDHEAAHCLFTDFTIPVKAFKSRFHKELTNAIEDSRIELLMPKKWPGTAMSLERLNLKWQTKLDAKRHELPWPIRLILTVRDIYDGKPIREDKQIEPLIASVLPQCKDLRKAKNTRDVVKRTGEIIDLINAKREELYNELGLDEADESDFSDGATCGETSIELDPKRKEKEAKEAEGVEQLDPATEWEEKEGKEKSTTDSTDEDNDSDESETDSKTEKKGDKSDESDEFDEEDESDEFDEGEESASDEEGNADITKSDSSKYDEDNDEDAGELETRKNYAEWKDTPEEAKMLKDGVDEPSEFDNHEFNTESYMDAQFEDAVAKEPDVQNTTGMYHGKGDKINPKLVSLPYTREYDVVTDYTGKGSRKEYAERKRMIMKQINPIKQHLERVLKVKENKKIVTERERGGLNHRTLANLCIDKNYRTPFKEFSKVDTRNVAVSLVIDCSGSMSYNKIEVARQTGLALGESLKALDITFEMVGFNTNDYISMASDAKRLSNEEISRFNRFGTGLNHMVFKSFDSTDLSGICMARAGGCNADGESLSWAAKRLAERREKRKIMMVLSDGQPSYGGANHVVLAGDLKRVINLMPKAGIEPIGIGICTHDPKLFYDNYVIVEDVSKLATTVVKKLANLLEEGYKVGR